MDHQISLAFRIPALLVSALFLLLRTDLGLGLQYKVGDLDSWGIPPPSKSHVYSLWSQRQHFKIGDSLLFLYPPSQDSVIQVTRAAFDACSTADPILKMNDGNSLFNITKPGKFYFTSGFPGHCEKNQKLEIAVPSANGTFFPPADGPAGIAAGAPAMAPGGSSAYPTVFGPSAAAETSGSLGLVEVSLAVAAAWLAAIGGVLLLDLV